MTNRSSSTERLRDAVIGVVLLAFAFSIWLFFIPQYAGGHGPHTILAQIAAILIGLLSLLLLALCALGLPTESTTAVGDDPFLDTAAGREPPQLLGLALIWGVAVAGFHYVGFYIAGGLAIGTSLVLLGIRSPLGVVLWTVGALVGSYLVFDLALRLMLPQGVWVRALVASYNVWQ